MTDRFEQLRGWMAGAEDEHLEFKEARTSFGFEDVVKYCVALANEGGGRLILGITDKRPRRIVGSQAFPDPGGTKASLVERLRLRIDVDALAHPDGRVVIFSVPSRPLGVPIEYRGSYWMRAGESLVPMTTDMLKRILAETGPDFSAEVCPGASMADLNPAAIARLRTLWGRKSDNSAVERWPDEQLLRGAELLVDGGLTYAALILLGTREALGSHLGQAEMIFEYRSSDIAGPAQQREEFREGGLLFLDRIWELVNLRNDKQHFQDGLFIWDVPTFNEIAIREAVLNAVSHRDYRLPGSVFVRQYPRRIEIVSPGGLPPGITPENILWKQAPRNRRIAETLTRCGLVERAGQGVNRMVEESIKQSKLPPDFSRSDDYEVFLTLRGEIQDARFLRFLEKIGRETLASFAAEDFMALDLVHREQPITDWLRPRLAALVDQGIVEEIGRGKWARYMLSRQFYGFLGQAGVYTRKRGLDRETNKALLLKHIQDSEPDGCQLQELRQVLPSLSRDQVQRLLQSLKSEGAIHNVRRTKASRWFLGLDPADPTT